MQDVIGSMGGYRGVRAELLVVLKKAQPLTATELAERFGLTPNALRRHLKVLEEDGVVRYQREVRGVGAPVFAYRLTEAGEAVFPRRYAAVLASALEALQAERGGRAVANVLAREWDALAIEAGPVLDGLPLAERVQLVAELLTARGYMAEGDVVTAASATLRIHNCAMCEIAHEFDHRAAGQSRVPVRLQHRHRIGDAAAGPDRRHGALHLGQEAGARVAARVAPQGVPSLADHDGAALAQRHLRAHRLSGGSYYSAPKSTKPLQSLDESIPSCSRPTTSSASRSPSRSARGVAVDASSTPSPSAPRTSEELEKVGVIFCSFGEAVREHPELVKKYLGSVVPYSDNFFAALNSPSSPTARSCYIPKGVRARWSCPPTSASTPPTPGQFERTLIVADEGSYVSYLEGCTAPKRDTNQLHAAVVEIVALDNATVKYSTVQNWYAGDENGVGGIYNFVTKRGKAMTNAKISWTQVETGSAITWKYPSVILQGDNSVGEFYSVAVVKHAAGRHRHEDDPHRPQHEEHDRLEGHLGGKGQNSYRGR
jgi:predicted ArsR family transcriptional regulator